MLSTSLNFLEDSVPTAATSSSTYGAPSSVATVALIVVLAIYVLGFFTVVLAFLRSRRAMSYKKLQETNNADFQEWEDAEHDYAPHLNENLNTLVLPLGGMGRHYQLHVNRSARQSLESFRALSSLLQSSDDNDSCASETNEEKDGVVSFNCSGIMRRRRKANVRSGSDAERPHVTQRQTEKRRGNRHSRVAGTPTIACALRLEQPKLAPADEDDSQASLKCCHTTDSPKERQQHGNRGSLTSSRPSCGISRVTSSEGQREQEEEYFYSPLDVGYSHAVSICGSPLARAFPTVKRSTTAVSASLSSSACAVSALTGTVPESGGKESFARRFSLIDTSVVYDADNEAECDGGRRERASVKDNKPADPTALACGDLLTLTATTLTSSWKPQSPSAETILVDKPVTIRGPSTFM
ncbi:hypothetical protein ABL78_0211 [Leptomonas seymouri]|uniref:Transmembrane protein n=1 Tax=Leptomonas seymouri TaxID=5684 RepID=A0A0N1IAI8_LEPSE|nr:hypothetical protein ABL78_0211 [Leptomonas seymouri]|eukprot:KPI90615.1 hypothetical protein ABL78_0211 [Leptomonas seymouri]